MNKILFKEALSQLNDADFQSVIDGKDLQILDDSRIRTGEPDSPNSIVHSAKLEFDQVAGLKEYLLENADEILTDYYQTNPLSVSGFNNQVQALGEKHGVSDFIAQRYEVSTRTFFVELGEVISETKDSPRHQYGVFFETEKDMGGMTEQAKADAFNNWLASGEAHSHYIGMNTCRYNC